MKQVNGFLLLSGGFHCKTDIPPELRC